MKKIAASLLSDKNLRRLMVSLVLLGFLLRLVCYLQDRCLFIDEANVARNIYERSFQGLTLPLNYEQYAPPLFLWMVKFCTLLFGYSEYAFRLFPLLCGLGSLVLMSQVLKLFAGIRGIWYAMAILATGIIYVRYGAELKQYECDILITLILLLLALKVDIMKWSGPKFMLCWGVVGAVAVWWSMPSVFILSGVAFYYLYNCRKSGNQARILWLVIVGVFWAIQFAVYYFFILRNQIGSEYLKNCHKDFFLYPWPATREMREQDITVFVKSIAAMGGKWTLSVVFHVTSMAVGTFWLLMRHRAKALLILVPICALIGAAMGSQYALTPRLILFVMPLLLILVAKGLELMLTIQSMIVRAMLISVALINIYNLGAFNLFFTRLENEEITKTMAFAVENNLRSDRLYVHNGAMPAYLYYTTIHPNKQHWNQISNAHILQWNSNYDSIALQIQGRFALLYSWAPDDEIERELKAISRYHHMVKKLEVSGGHIFIWE